MKHLKKYEDLGVYFTLLGAAAFIKIVYNLIKRKNIVRGIRSHDFKKLEYIVDQWKDSKTRLGNIIDNNEISQVVYEYGGSDNIIIFTLDKTNDKFTFEWNFSQPVFPFIKFENSDRIELNLHGTEINEIQKIFNKLKSEKFKINDDL
jgi:hypothetical protein